MSREARADHPRRIMVAVAGEVRDRHLARRGWRRGSAARSRLRPSACQAGLPCASIIWRRASTALCSSASRIFARRSRLRPTVRSPSTLRITSSSPASSKSARIDVLGVGFGLGLGQAHLAAPPTRRAAGCGARSSGTSFPRRARTWLSKARSRSSNWVIVIPCLFAPQIGARRVSVQRHHQLADHPALGDRAIASPARSSG